MKIGGFLNDVTFVRFKVKLCVAAKYRHALKKKRKTKKPEKYHDTKCGSPNHPDLAAIVRMILKMILV